MKRQMNKIKLLFVAILAAATAFGQVSTYSQQAGYWTLGLNGGLAYQQSDIPSLLNGYGAGLTLGKNIFYKPGAPFSFDLRGRALYTRTYGLDTKPSFGITNNDALNGTKGPNYLVETGGSGFVFQNNKTDLFELGAEGVLTFNQLAERTNVLLSLYGGVGVDWYKTTTDQLGANGTYAADYQGIDTRRSSSSIRNELRNTILDGQYETNAHGFGNTGKLGIMPSLGVELGYQLTPRFSMGIGHRVTFAGNDLLDGQQWNDANHLTGDKDLHHYTSLHMRWKIQPEQARPKAPQITITSPRSNPHSSVRPNAEVRADIKYVNNAMDVDARLNGQSIYFDYHKGRFDCQFPLEFGRNELVITATNSVGRDRKKVIILYQEAIIDQPNPPQHTYAPQVNITRPSQSSTNVQDDRYTIKATIRHIVDRHDIRFTINGREQHNFEYRPGRDAFTADIRLDYGRNDIRIEVFNPAGNDSDAATLFYEKRYQQNPPRIRITKPNRNPYNTEWRQIKVEAQIDYIERSSDIEYIVNGKRSRNFDFARNSFGANTPLKEGRNSLIIKAFNEHGEDREELIVFYQFNETCNGPLPEVDITRPQQYHSTTEQPTASVRAQVKNVERKSDIKLFHNGRSSNSFRFQKNSGRVETRIDLQEGENSIKIEVRNANGTDDDEVMIVYQKKVIYTPKPPTVTIHKPRNNSTTEQPNTRLEAKVTNISDKRDIDLKLNGRSINNFSFDKRRGTLTASLQLREGTNTISLRAVNKDGEDQESVKVRYQKKVIYTPKPPTVTIHKPRNNSTTEQPNTRLEAKVTNISDKRDIDLKLNGRSINNFSFDKRRGTLTASLQLREGTNTISLRAVNKDGKDQESVKVRYQKKVIYTPKPPTVSIHKPRNNSTVTTSSTAVKASMKHITSKDQITFKLNGKAVRSYTFGKNSLSAKVTLKEGRNQIEISVRNEDGSDKDAVSVTYKKPMTLPKPTAKFVAPRKAGEQVSEYSYVVKVNIQHVKKREDIQFWVNGKRTSKFTFESKKQLLSAKVRLGKGRNDFKVEAKNEAGKATATTYLVYKTKTIQVAAPKISELAHTRPTANPLSPSQAKTRITAKLANISSERQIDFRVNGKRITNFDFDTRNKAFSALITLNKGKNTVTLKVTNQGGSDDASLVIEF